MKSLGVLYLGVLLVLGAQSCQPPDCDHPDCGSCANACCSIDFMFDDNPDNVYKKAVSNLQNGGADGRYKYIAGFDYRKDNTTLQYQLQAMHTTLVHRYNDTLDFLVLKDDTSTILQSFSISRIAGAYCDDGQNYKNLAGFVKGLDLKFEMKVKFGCMKTSF